jgi:hypothetical protein
MESKNKEGLSNNDNPPKDSLKIEISNSSDISAIKKRFEEFVQETSDENLKYTEVIYDPSNIRFKKD